MPSKKNPSSIQSGTGAKSSENKTSFSLNPVKTGSVDESASTHAEAQNDHKLGGKQSPLANHLSPNGISHNASQISIDQRPKEIFTSTNVEGALDELSALIPPKPPKIGFERSYMENSGYPDWGVLKLRESSLLYRDSASFLNDNTPSRVYPYYWRPPHPAEGFEPESPDGTGKKTFDYTPYGNWSYGGDDPHTDPTFNVSDGAYTGGGYGRVFAGAFTRDTDGDPSTPNTAHHTLRIYPMGSDTEFGVVLSGIVYPADRGVLALFHYEEGGSLESFMAQSLDKRVVCAILLGTGMLNDGCPCDGDVGGIFQVGTDNSGDYDPYAFPGQATGQGDLYEIHTGLLSGSASTVHQSASVYRNYDGLSSETFEIVSSTATTNPTYETTTNHSFAIGDIVTIRDHSVSSANGDREITAITPNTFTVSRVGGAVAPSGGGTGGTVVREVGCSPSDYTVLPYPGQVRLGTDPHSGVTPLVGGIPILGATSHARGGGDDNNFFRYRLPYLDDYSSSSGSGLKWSPVSETGRFYMKPSVSLDPSSLLENAGDYAPFSKDYFPFQVARYRHRFIVDSCMCNPSGVTDGFDLGSYVLIHFKKEKFFEEFVRDGIVPTSDQIYSASLATFNNAENVANVASSPAIANESQSYHIIRSTIFGENGDGIDPPTVANNQYTISRVLDNVMWCSGVAYFIPDDFELDTVQTDIVGLFENSYRTNDYPTSGSPLYLNHPNPVLFSMSAFSWDYYAGTEVPSLYSDLGFARLQKIELNLIDLGYSETNAPSNSDTASVSFKVTPQGDYINPSFSVDAKARLFFRKPIGHENTNTAILPYTGYPVGSADDNTILYSSIVVDVFSSNGIFGNVQVNYGTDDRSVESVSLVESKYTSERFLDEVFRYDSTFSAIQGADPLLASKLTGPGLPLGGGSIIPVEIPPVAGRAVNATATELWADSSWIQQNKHRASISGSVELQVGGLPHRNPPFTEGVIYPVPSNGMLSYPKTDYTTAHRPKQSFGDITGTQFDYSSETGEKQYVRVFGLDQTYTGKSVVTLKIDGLELQDFAYNPSGSGSDNMAIFVKVPGMTTWLDIGRRDGDGPSKQDPLLDGAGCQVVGTDTVNGYDTESGYRYCTVKINVGSTANFFSFDDGFLTICPLMIKVLFYDTAESKYYDFAHEIDPTTRIPTSTINENANTRDVRALIGISVVNES